MAYPDQIDLVWLAVDEGGQFAAVVTGGQGPVPQRVLASLSDGTDVEAELLDLPVIGEALLLAALPNPDSFQALSRRGLFVYDWTDVHRTSAAAIGAYELVAKPSVLLHRQALSASLTALAWPISGAAFGVARLAI